MGWGKTTTKKLKQNSSPISRFKLAPLAANTNPRFSVCIVHHRRSEGCWNIDRVNNGPQCEAHPKQEILETNQSKNAPLKERNYGENPNFNPNDVQSAQAHKLLSLSLREIKPFNPNSSDSQVQSSPWFQSRLPTWLLFASAGHRKHILFDCQLAVGLQQVTCHSQSPRNSVNAHLAPDRDNGWPAQRCSRPCSGLPPGLAVGWSPWNAASRDQTMRFHTAFKVRFLNTLWAGTAEDTPSWKSYWPWPKMADVQMNRDYFFKFFLRPQSRCISMQSNWYVFLSRWGRNNPGLAMSVTMAPILCDFSFRYFNTHIIP